MDDQENTAEKEQVPSFKEVSLSKKKLADLSMLDPHSHEVQEWMTANEINFGDDLIVHVDGLPDAVFVTREDDFMTRDRKASEAWNSREVPREADAVEDEAVRSAAERIVDDGDEASVEKEISIEDAEELGDDVLELVDIKKPEEAQLDEAPTQESMYLEAAERLYELRVEALRDEVIDEIAKLKVRLDEHAQSIGQGKNVIKGGARIALSHLEAAVNNYDDYINEGVRTFITRAIGDFEVARRGSMSYSSITMDELARAIDATTKSFQQKQEHAYEYDADFNRAVSSIDPEHQGDDATTKLISEANRELHDSTAELRKDLDTLTKTVADTVVDEFSEALALLDQLKIDAGYRQIMPDDLLRVIRQVRERVIENNSLEEQIEQGNQKLQAASDKLQKFLGKLKSTKR